MTDKTIQDRLRSAACDETLSIGEAWDILHEAADFIDRLRAELAAKDDAVKALVEAAQPFAHLLHEHHSRLPDDQTIFAIGDSKISVGAMRALAKFKEKP